MASESTPQPAEERKDDGVEVTSEKKPEPTLEKASSEHSDVPVALQGESKMTTAKLMAVVALGMAYTTGVQQLTCTSTILRYIDMKLGPTTYYNWMISSYTIAIAVSMPLAGGLSDIFGRRHFLLGGCVISLIGTIIAAVAQSIPQVIAGMILKGIGGATQQLAMPAIGEIVSNKHRGYAQAFLDILLMPWMVFGALTGGAMVKFQEQSFRINWYVGIILNLVTIALTYVWYFPPAYVKIIGKTRRQQLAELDWIGITLFAAGMVLGLVGIAVGGITYPWKHATTISTLTLGGLFMVAFGIWEWKLAPRPFMDHSLFRGKFRTFVLILIIQCVAGMGLYAASAFWTQQVFGMWNTDPIRIGVVTIPGGMGGAIGGFLAGVLIGKHWLLSTNLCLVYGAVIKVVADAAMTTLTPHTLNRAMGLGFISMFGTGWSSIALIVCVQLASNDKNIGLATLLCGSSRAVGGSVAVTVYTTLLQNRVKKAAIRRVIPAVIPLGLKPQYIEPMIYYLKDGRKDLAAKLPGALPNALPAAEMAMKWAYTEGFKQIYIAATAFAAVSLVAAFFVKDVSHEMTDNVAVRLENEAAPTKEAA